MMTYTELHINKFYLMLGGNCNYACRHCIQCEANMKEDDVSEKVFLYIRHLANIRPPQIGKITVMFWGGEPLLYFNKIKKVVEELGDIVEYAMVSNGSLLTTDIVDFCNEHKIQYVLSNDGPNTEKVRGENLLENEAFINIFKRLENKAINSVISAYNQDYYVLWEYLDKKVPGVPVYTELLECSWDMPEDLYQFDFAAYKNIMKTITEKARADLLSGKISREINLIHPYIKTIMNVVKKLDNGEDVFPVYPRCKQVRRSMNVDLIGNIYTCHNFSKQIGTVDDDYETLLERYDLQYKLSESCIKCEHLAFCQGGCPFVKDSFGKMHCCEMKNIFITACLELVASFAGLLEEVEV